MRSFRVRQAVLAAVRASCAWHSTGSGKTCMSCVYSVLLARSTTLSLSTHCPCSPPIHSRPASIFDSSSVLAPSLLLFSERFDLSSAYGACLTLIFALLLQRCVFDSPTASGRLLMLFDQIARVCVASNDCIHTSTAWLRIYCCDQMW